MEKSFIRTSGRPILFAFLYAMVVSLAILIIDQSRFSIFRKMEFSIYDYLQKAFTIDHRKDGLLYDKYGHYLDSWAFIDIDEPFFNQETGRVEREKLNDLLTTLSKNSGDAVIFLDFLFTDFSKTGKSSDSLSEAINSRLYTTIKSLEDRIILPYRIKPTEDASRDICSVWNENNHILDSTLYFDPADLKFSGYLAPSREEGDSSYRFENRIFENRTRISAVQRLIELTTETGASSVDDSEKCQRCFEINYVLRDHPINQNVSALDKVHASYFINLPDTSETVKMSDPELSSKQVIFIGLFSERYTKKHQPIDLFDTPVKKKMNGIYIVINTYLNLITGSCFKSTSRIFIFTVNLFLGFVAVWYKRRLQSFIVKPFWLYCLEAFVIVLFFSSLVIFSYLSFQLKFPIIITSLFFMKNQMWYAQFLKISNSITL